MKRKLSFLNGFAVVELIVVLVVVGILAAITVVAYQSTQTSSMDARIKVMVNDAGKILHMEKLKNNCPSATGYWSNTGGVDSILVPAHFTSGYRDDLKSTNAPASSTHVLRYYYCTPASGINSFAIYASLNDSTAEDIANLLKLEIGAETPLQTLRIHLPEPTRSTTTPSYLPRSLLSSI